VSPERRVMGIEVIRLSALRGLYRSTSEGKVLMNLLALILGLIRCAVEFM
jgi:hypothetical protein